MIRNLWPIYIIFFNVFFCNIIKVNYFLYCLIILFYLISSFSLTRSTLIPYAYVSIKSIDCIFYCHLNLELMSSLKALWVSLFDLCCGFNINLLFFTNSFNNIYFSRLLWLENVYILKDCSFNFSSNFCLWLLLPHKHLYSIKSSLEYVYSRKQLQYFYLIPKVTHFYYHHVHIYI